MPICIRCQSDVGLLGRLSFNSQKGRCGKCEKETQQGLLRFRQAFLNASTSRLISEEDIASILRQSQYDNLDHDEALAYILGDALHFLERALTFFYSDRIIQLDEENYIRAIIHRLHIPELHATPLLQRLNRLKALTRIREGHLPTVRASIQLESDEICHMEIGATYHKVNLKSVTYIQGRLVATNKRLHFLSPAGGSEILWKRILRVEQHGSGIYLELSTKKANGQYDVPDPERAEAVVETLTRIAKRQLIAPQDEAASRHIPQDIKQAVWQRDQGKCIQCAATAYLEFDHIIPFSKGGASTLNNIQLLCRKCNLAKGGRL
jgi:5-methylcytosine-specific restriction endonuclease McrA